MARKGGASVLDLTDLDDKEVRVRFVGGREVLGILKGFDQMMNVVLENCVEFLRDPADPTILTDSTRHLGLVVCKGSVVSMVMPTEGMHEIANPFLAADAE